MEDISIKKKTRRKKNKAKTDIDVELADHAVGDLKQDNIENESNTWIEKENREQNREPKDKSITVTNKGKSKTKLTSKEKILETNVDEVDAIQVDKEEELPPKSEDSKSSKIDKEEQNVSVKKSGFKFKLKSLNPLKSKKKDKPNEENIVENDKDAKEEGNNAEDKDGQIEVKDKSDETYDIKEETTETGTKKKKTKKSEKLKQKDMQKNSNDDEKEEIEESKDERKRKMAIAEKVSEEQEDTLDETEKSEAENIIHELPSASSTDKADEPREVGKKMSAKEKLKQKLDKKKSSDREPAKLLRHLSSQSSRVEDRLKEEDLDAQFAFDKHDITMKNKREKMDKEISSQDAFDFFTATWDDIPSGEPEPEQKDAKKRTKKANVASPSGDDDEDKAEEDEDGYETANEEPEEADDKKKLLAREYIGAQYEWEVTEWTGPEILPYKTRIENEKEVFYTPSAFPPTLEEIMASSGSKFNPEQEGVYTGKKPFVQPTNINKMENR